MTSKEKQNMRYQRAEERIFRVQKYPENPAVRQLCRLEQQRDQLSKSIDKQFAYMRERGFVPGRDNREPAFFADFDLICQWTKQRDRIIQKITRIEKTHDLKSEEALKDFYLMNRGRGSQSY